MIYCQQQEKYATSFTISLNWAEKRRTVENVRENFSRWELQSRLPGKTDRKDRERWLPVWVHLEDTAQVMRYLCRYWLPDSARTATGLGENLEPFAVFLALIHDIGKFTACFLAMIAGNLPDEVREFLREQGFETNYANIPYQYKESATHSLNGAQILRTLGCPEGVCAIVAAHHGKPEGVGSDVKIENCPGTYFGRNGRDNEMTPFWRDTWQEWLQFALKETGFASPEELPATPQPTQMLLSGLLIMADWIASNTRWFPLLEADDNGETLDLAFRTQQAWAAIDLPGPWMPDTAAFSAQDFRARFGFAPNAVQRAVMETVRDAKHPGILILEAQMGVGKTEAALCAAEELAARDGCGGLFFGLPTQAPANGIFPRILSWSEQEAEDMRLSIKLAHGAAELNDEYQELLFHPEDNVEIHPFFEGRKQSLLANMVVGTVDQLLLMALKQKHLMLRHLGMAGKVVVVDECHAYDAYMNRYLDRALSWLGSYGVPVIILSATLPAKRRSELVDAYVGKVGTAPPDWRIQRGYPLLTWSDGKDIGQKTIPVDTPSREVTVTRIEDENLPGLLRQNLEQGGCAGVIVNTVRRAQALADRLRTELPDCRIVLFHANFLMPDRAEKERLLVKNLGKNSTPEQRDKLIVVGTQVLEQSLDIDFDLMATDLCPMDLLLQRMGRLHRHAWRTPQRPEPLRKAQCFVMGAGAEMEDGSKAVYGEWLLYRTAELLPERVSLPDDIPTLVQDTYEEPAQPLGEPAASYREKFENDRRMLEQQAETFRIEEPDMDDPDETIDGMLDVCLKGNEKRELAAVRCGDPSLEVLVMVLAEEGKIAFLPWQEGGRSLAADHVPCEEDCRAVARQKLRLPAAFSRPYCIGGVIRELEEQMRNLTPEWQQSRWLKGELILFLDAGLNARLAGYTLHYDRETGLIYTKEESDGKQGI